MKTTAICIVTTMPYGQTIYDLIADETATHLLTLEDNPHGHPITCRVGADILRFEDLTIAWNFLVDRRKLQVFVAEPKPFRIDWNRYNPDADNAPYDYYDDRDNEVPDLTTDEFRPSVEDLQAHDAALWASWYATDDEAFTTQAPLTGREVGAWGLSSGEEDEPKGEPLTMTIDLGGNAYDDDEDDEPLDSSEDSSEDKPTSDLEALPYDDDEDSGASPLESARERADFDDIPF